MIRILIPVMFFGIFLFGCKYEPPDEKLVFDHDKFTREKAAWEAQKYANYSFEVEDFGGGTPGAYVRISVMNGQFNDIEKLQDDIYIKDNIDNENELEIITLIDRFGTIPVIYDFIMQRYSEYNERLDDLKEYDYFYIDVKYNTQYHYPEHVSFGSSNYIDPPIGGWSSFTIKNFRTEP